MYRVYGCIVLEHDLRLVLASGLICFLASYTGFNLMVRAAEAATNVRAWWIGAAGFAVGSGIWATHFIAMLGFQPPIPVHYDLGVTAVSIIIAVVLSGIGVAVSARSGAGMRLLGGAVIGAGIGAMHYTGISAWRLAGIVEFDSVYVAASLGIGILGAGAATAIAAAKTDLIRRLTASLALALTICAVHFTGMTATGIRPDPTIVVTGDAIAAIILAIAVGAVTVLILALSLAGALIDERLAHRAVREAAALKTEIEQRKAAQAELQRHRDNLECEVVARTAALAASESRMIDAIETLPEAFVLFDADDRLVMCNAAYRALSETTRRYAKPGLAYEDLIRRAVERGDHAIDARGADQWMEQRLAQRKAVGSETVCSEQHRPDGRWLEIYERRMRDGGLVTLHVDVTEMRGRLALSAQREKLAALGQLAGGVAHEINNLLQPALLFPELICENLPTDDAESREQLEIITDSVRKARDIVRSILLYARKEETSLQTADLGSEVKRALKFIRGGLPPGVTLRERIDPRCGLAQFNRTELTQVLSNLVLNAAHATAGQGTIDIAVGQTRLPAALARELELEADACFATIAVADKGCGMDASTLARIFEPFFTTKPLGVGTGLGLSVVQGILHNWNGAIAVASEPGAGTTFTLYVPIVPRNEAGEAATPLAATG